MSKHTEYRALTAYISKTPCKSDSRSKVSVAFLEPETTTAATTETTTTVEECPYENMTDIQQDRKLSASCEDNIVVVYVKAVRIATFLYGQNHFSKKRTFSLLFQKIKAIFVIWRKYHELASKRPSISRKMLMMGNRLKVVLLFFS